MKKFVALYFNTSGKHIPAPAMSAEEVQAMMAPWDAWQKKYGNQILDLGAPFKTASSTKNGSQWAPSTNLVTGYSMVEASSLEEAQKMFEGHPITQYPDHSIEISECTPM